MATATLGKTDDGQGVTHHVGLVSVAQRIEAVGRHSIRYGLVLVLLWIGAMKFTAYEAEGIAGLVSNSPLMSWAYQVLSLRQFSSLIGVTELLIAGQRITASTRRP